MRKMCLLQQGDRSNMVIGGCQEDRWMECGTRREEEEKDFIVSSLRLQIDEG